MSDQSITCPNCSTQISVASTLTSQIRQQLEVDFGKRQQKMAETLHIEQEKIAKLQLKLEEDKKSIDQQVDQKLKLEKEKMWEIAQKKAQEVVELKLSKRLEELEEDNKNKAEQLKKAEDFELQLRKKAIEIEEKAAKLELDVQRTLDEERAKISEQTKKVADESYRLKLAEKDKQLDMMNKQIAELKRKSEQGSMQIQGEVQEDDLKHLLQTVFPTDQIVDVEKGFKGADLIQTIHNAFGQPVGKILWESKNTKAWSPQWLHKLKDDQGAIQADVAILVSQVLPQDVENFVFQEGVWIVKPQSVIALTHAVRMNLQQLAQLRNSLVGRDQKMEHLYNYLSGSQFRNRIEAIVSAFSQMKADLDKEKRAFERIWKKREQEIERVITNTSGMYGDFQGMIGAALPSVPSLELDLLDDGEEQTLF